VYVAGDRGGSNASATKRDEGLVSFELRDPDPDVLVVTNLWPHAGDPAYGIFVKRQVDSIREAGVRVHVMFIRGYLSRLAYAAAARTLAKLSRAGRPPYQLVHVHGGEAVLPAIAYRRAPIVASYLGDDLLGTRKADGRFPVVARLRRTVLRRSAHFVSHTITKSHEMHLALPRSCRARNDVVPSGVDDSLFVPVPRDQARQLLGWDPQARIAMFGGNPRVPGKRFWLAEAACKVASATLGPVQLERLIGVNPEDVPLMMSAADCLVLTSITEGSPNVVKEALMCGLPVIATPVGDVEDLLREVSPAWVCKPSTGALANALVECLQTPRRSNGRARSLHLGTRPIAERILSVYGAILSQYDSSTDSHHEGQTAAYRSLS
jgi:teichuronic acid biosynthesis glycosyltransferase TuaC